MVNEYRTGSSTFFDHLGRPCEKPKSRSVQWRPSVYALIPCKDGIVMVQPVDLAGKFMLPGGGVEPGESLIDGLRRECREELGEEISLHVSAPRYFGEAQFYSMWDKEYYHALLYVYSAEVSPEFIKRLPLSRLGDKEIGRVESIPLHRLTTDMCHPMVYEVLRRIAIKP